MEIYPAGEVWRWFWFSWAVRGTGESGISRRASEEDGVAITTLKVAEGCAWSWPEGSG